MNRSILIPCLLIISAATAVAQESAPAPRAAGKAGQAEISRALLSRMAAPKAAERTTYSFQISILLADIDGTENYQGLSKNAQKALEDLQDFLPFRSYRLLDFAWLRTSARSSARVQGPDGRTFELTLHLGGHHDDESGKLFISSFNLRETSGVNRDVEAGPLRAPQALISTSFGMDEGETVVVGTSRLDGDQRALVVLLTAVPASLGGN